MDMFTFTGLGFISFLLLSTAFFLFIIGSYTQGLVILAFAILFLSILVAKVTWT